MPGAWDAREPCRAWDPCRAFDPCRPGIPAPGPAGLPLPGLGSLPGPRSLPGLGSAVRPGLCRGGPVARPGRGAAGPAGEVGHRARHRRHALRAEVPRPACCAHHPGRTFPSRRAMTLGRAASASLPRRRLGDRRERRPRHGRATRARLPLAQEAGRLDLRRTTCGRRTVRGRTDLLAHRAEQLAVVDEAVHALRGQRAGERVRVDREVRRGVPADRAQGSGRVAGDHLDVAVEQHPVAGLWLVAVAKRMPAVVRLRVLHDRGDLRRVRVEVDPDVGPPMQRPGIGGSPGDPALLPGGLSAEGEREAGEGGTRLAVIRAVDAVDAPDHRLHLGRALRLRHAQVVLRHLDDGRPQGAIPGLLGLGGLVQGHELDRHPGRRRHLVDGPVGEGEPGHGAACAETDQRGRLLPRRFPQGRHGFTSILVCVRAGGVGIACAEFGFRLLTSRSAAT